MYHSSWTVSIMVSMILIYNSKLMNPLHGVLSPWEANSCSVSQISCTSRNTKSHSYIWRNLPLVSNLNQAKYVYSSYFFTINVNIILPRSFRWSLSFMISHKNLVCIAFLCYVFHMSYPSSISWLSILVPYMVRSENHEAH